MRRIVSPIIFIITCSIGSNILAQDKYQLSLEKLNYSKSKRDRFYNLPAAAKMAFCSGNIPDAKQFSLELLQLAPNFIEDSYYGNAIHDGNMVLGRISVKDNNIKVAIEYLILAGKTPGSPVLNSFGPNMNLAKDLLEKGEKAAVLEYFKLCSNFWSHHQDYLDKWTSDINNDHMPDFKSNLYY